jgi:amidase
LNERLEEAAVDVLSRISFCNDSGGSIRIPAHFCGIFGLKSSFGALRTDGILTVQKRKPSELKLRTLISSGMLAQSIDDLQISLDVLGKRHLHKNRSPRDETSKLNLLWIDELPDLEVDTEIKRAIQKLIETLAIAGVTLTRFDTKNFDFMETIRIWGHLSNYETGTELPFLARTIGNRVMRKKYNKIPMYTHLLKPLSKNSYRALRHRQEEMKVKFEQLLEGYDGFILPACSVVAFPHQLPNRKIGHLGIYTTPLTINDRKVHYAIAVQAYSLPFNVLESPVVSLPIGLNKEHLPIGIQLVGKKNHDFDLLNTAEKLSKIIPTIGKPPVFST